MSCVKKRKQNIPLTDPVERQHACSYNAVMVGMHLPKLGLHTLPWHRWPKGGRRGLRDVGFLIYDFAIFHRAIAVSLHRLAFQQIPSTFGFDWRMVSDASLSPFPKHQGLIYTSSPTALTYSWHATDSTIKLKPGYPPLVIFTDLSSIL